MNMLFDLNKISKHRTALMGISALLIVLCHANLYDIKVNSVTARLFSLGNVGVDIFLFLSGVGCYYSLKTGGLLKWYKKRFFRIFIPYTLAQIPYWGFYIIKGDFDLIDSLYEFSTIAFWVRHTGMWYIALLIPLYVLTPFMFKAFNNTRHRMTFAIILSILILLLCNINFSLNNNLADEIISNVQWAFYRIVSFLLGLAIAPKVINNTKINVLYIFLGTAILIAILRLLRIDYYWCLFAVFIILSVYILEKAQKNLYSFCSFLGVISLESYLFNGYVRYAFMDSPIYSNNSILLYGHYLDYFMIFVIGTLFAVIINRISSVIIKKINL